MNKLVMLVMCSIALVGCEGKTLEELREEVAVRETATAAKAAKLAEAQRTTFEFVGADGYTRKVIKICLNGIQYYTGDIGHGAVLAPVISSLTYLPAPCEK